MKFNRFAMSALCATVVFTGAAFAQQPVQQPIRVMDAGNMAKAVTITATVAAIDMKNRVITLKGPEGNEFAVKAGSAVKGLDKIQVGDSVDATYVRAEALDFQKGDGIRMAARTVAADAAGSAGMPGAAAVERTTVVTNIWAINEAQGNVTVLGPHGHLTEVHLKDPTQLIGVKVGDQMKITYTQAVATEVVKKA
ncbi:hypothetical protein [Variovorax sp. GT1P44]|uniref:hypothetical protein n=1 Tax=Variovorax sp. GT1P44 TaxID=3443742 RepID=UPI003F48FDA1